MAQIAIKAALFPAGVMRLLRTKSTGRCARPPRNCRRAHVTEIRAWHAFRVRIEEQRTVALVSAFAGSFAKG